MWHFVKDNLRTGKCKAKKVNNMFLKAILPKMVIAGNSAFHML